MSAQSMQMLCAILELEAIGCFETAAMMREILDERVRVELRREELLGA